MSLFARVYPTVAAIGDRAGLTAWRRQLTSGLRGDVLEIGAGPGTQARWYHPDARVTALERDETLHAALMRSPAAGVYDDVVVADAEALPFPDASFDHVVFALVLCSITNIDAALAEVRRVLRPGGTVRALEHVRANGDAFAAVQHACAGPWRRVAGGCNLDRDTATALRAAGFTVRTERSAFNGTLVLLDAIDQSIHVSGEHHAE